MVGAYMHTHSHVNAQKQHWEHLPWPLHTERSLKVSGKQPLLSEEQRGNGQGRHQKMFMTEHCNTIKMSKRLKHHSPLSITTGPTADVL